ncbi:MAG: aerobic-type carbon monoxide dehydrogenase, large subunit CoxL/CutL-like protein, partial [Dehalococcoidia bacterium]|nr:aerobic-type carbon monoxide dehydrogenase, large subunit CoxL/CutL-like protein [Dehalococcoidia bacterium]
GPYGAKGLGEAVMVTPAPAIAQAIYEAVGVRLNDSPITKQQIMAALKAQRDKKG